MDSKGYRTYIRAFIHLIKYVMKRKLELTKFREGDTNEHEGVTYEAVMSECGRMCEGCAFHKYGGPCKSPRGWVCIEIGSGKNLIFKKVK